MKKRAHNLYLFIKQVFVEYSTDNALKYSASLAYYTIFSLAPMLIIIIASFGFLFGQEAMEGRIYDQIKGLVGSEAAVQVQATIKNVHLSGGTSVATIISVAALIFGATGIFGEIQDSLNKIWGLKLKGGRRSFLKVIINRLLSFSLVLSMGFVLMVSLIINAVVSTISNHLNEFITGSSKVLVPIINMIVSVSINTVLFAAIFKVLPDARIKWKDVFVGSLITAILFAGGRWAIEFYITSSNLATMYGAAGSIIIILLWTYYSAAILYLGAEFTKVYAKQYGGKIRPNDYSVWIKTEEVPVKDLRLNVDVKKEEMKKEEEKQLQS